ncbi:hypothetical protein [Streptomyces sp. NPDC088261]|uniref:hypothetical protein n=1 Tax=Streptomyces sp. NPDC088261 TaxID=3365851 RepID=UPI003802333A
MAVTHPRSPAGTSRGAGTSTGPGTGSGTGSAAGRHLAELLARPGPYRDRWLRQVVRATHEPVNQAAVARVLAHWLWLNGDAAASELLPRALRDRVSRALGGHLLSADTLRLFTAAFTMDEEDETALWALLDETSP